MATFISALRSYNAAMRRVDRENKRRAKEAERRFREQQKMQGIDDAQKAVESWEEYVGLITSMHKACTDPVDWHEFISASRPEPPVRVEEHTENVKREIENFRPSILDRLFLDKLFSSVEKKRNKLAKKLIEAQKEDESIHRSKTDRFEKECNELEFLQQMASGVLNKDIVQYKAALDYFDPFSDISGLGIKIELNFDKEFIDADIHVHGNDVIPEYVLSQTSTGKLSKKSMTKSAFNELYQDHVCSSVLRIARELFNYIPTPYVRVNAISELLDTQTGHMEEVPIVSVVVSKKTIDKINLDTIDPSDSMGNFIHSMKFKKTSGFQKVEKVAIPVQN